MGEQKTFVVVCSGQTDPTFGLHFSVYLCGTKSHNALSINSSWLLHLVVKAPKKHPVLTSFNLEPGQILVRKYEVLRLLGEGWEGQVYLAREITTNIERTIKLFFPQRNLKGQAAKFYAIKLHKLRHCSIVIQYYTQETIIRHKTPITLLVSEYVEGEMLSEFIDRQPGKRLSPFQAVHLLHALACGIECIHAMNEYHGDLHTDNIVVERHGLGFDLKLIDFYQWIAPKAENVRQDVIDMVKIFYDAVGGRKYYSKQPAVVKDICRGLKRKLILQNFRSAGELREFLENIEWE